MKIKKKHLKKKYRKKNLKNIKKKHLKKKYRKKK